MIVYLPILTLEGIEGDLFRPMALTVVFALLGSLVLSITLMPVLPAFSSRAGQRPGTTWSCVRPLGVIDPWFASQFRRDIR